MQGGLSNTAKRTTMLQWICNQHPLAVMLQETWLTEDASRICNMMASEAPEYTIFTSSACGSKASGGSAVLAHKSIAPAVLKDKIYCSSEGNILAVPFRTLIGWYLSTFHVI